MNWMKSLLIVLVVTVSAPAQDVCVRLKAHSRLDVPVHPTSGNPGVSHRLADGTIAQKLETDEDNGWIRIKANAVEGWIIKKYIDAEVACPSETAPVPAADSSVRTYVVGSWNLEHFHDGKVRGFPENTQGGPSYPIRIQEDYESIAAVIEQIGLKVVAMSEIHAEEVEVVEDGETLTDVRSPELERLIEILGRENYDYVMGESGNDQHLAILYDKRSARLNASWEMELPRIKIQGKQIADRQPLVGHFTLLDGGDRNDLAVVAVHLASGQQNNRNHDEAMRLIRQELAKAQAEGWCIPTDENDILIMGDFNANRFDNHQETFWDLMEGEGWDVLAKDANYSPTRLSGNPLGLKNSRIDYIIATKGDSGLQGDEISQSVATVHTEFIAAGAEEFRKRCSDHLPVSVSVKVMEDTDSAIAARSWWRRNYAVSEN